MFYPRLGKNKKSNVTYMTSRQNIAKQAGLDSNWLQQLAGELGVGERTLRTQMKDFRASNRVPEQIRTFYPTERGIEMFGSAFPQIHTIDFVLSFLSSSFEEAKIEGVAFHKFGKAVVDQSRRRHILSVTKSLDAENLRRKEYWEARQSHIEEVLCGTYVLFRPSLTVSGDKSFKKVYTEIMHIRLNEEFPQVLQAYWRRWTQNKKIFYTGNFFISTNFLYGTFVNRSSDEVLKPVNINILSKHAQKSDLQQFVLTGSLTGTDFSQEKIIHYPIALKRTLPRQLPDHERFLGIDKINDTNFCEFSDALLDTTDVSFETDEMLEFIKGHHVEFGALALNNLK